jgi:Mg-chelatase subunit ChlD
LSRLISETPRRASRGGLLSVPYAGGSDELDIEATLEALVANPFPTETDIVVRERRSSRRSVALLIDISGSMRGERIKTAAATVGALAAQLSDHDLAVIAFWSGAAVLQHLGANRTPRDLLDQMMRLPARGLTNVQFPLTVAARELGHRRGADARAILLSDCVHNAGPDPRSVASTLPRLDVLLDTSGENDTEMGRDLARLGRGRLALARDYHDVAPALTRLFER